MSLKSWWRDFWESDEERAERLEWEGRKSAISYGALGTAEAGTRLEEAQAAPPPATLACTCGFTHFTAGGQSVTAHADGRMRPSGGVLTCLKCGARWALCGNALIEPHPHAMPPVWTAQDLRESERLTVGSGSTADPERIRRLQSAVRRSATEHLRPRPRS